MASLEENRISELLWEKMTINQTKIQKAKEASDKSLSPGQKFIGKKKKYYFRNRDSQAFRESPGKPGTKRFNRYLNTLFLKNASSLNDQFEAEMEFSHYTMNNHLYYQDNAYFESLFNITYDKQQEMISSLQKKRKSNNTNNNNNNSNSKQQQQQRIEQSFSKLRKSLRPIFKQPFVTNSHFITETENQLINFCQQNFLKSIEVCIPDPYQRILLHGMVDYYSLLSKSYTNSEGQRCTLIIKPKVLPSFPNQSLTSYLLQEQLKASKRKSTQSSSKVSKSS